MPIDLIARHSRAVILGGVALCALGLAPSPARADAEADARALSAAVEAAGCFITGENQEQILSDAGIDTDRGFAALQLLVGRQQMRLSDEMAVLTVGACVEHAHESVPAEELAARRAAVIAAIATVGCRVRPSRLEAALAPTGLDEETGIATMMMLAAEGEASFEQVDGSDTFILRTGPCAEDAAPAHDSATVDLALRLVVELREAGCAATGPEVDALVSALGGETVLAPAAAALNEGGHLLSPRAPRGAVLLSEALCAASDSALGPELGRALRPSANPAPGSRLGGARLFAAELRASQCLFSRPNALGFMDSLLVGDGAAVLDRMAEAGVIRIDGEFLAATDLACTGDPALTDAFLAPAFDGVKRKS